MIPPNHANIIFGVGQNASEVYDIMGQPICRIWIPESFLGTTITFEGGMKQGLTWPLFDEFNIQAQITITAGRSYAVPVEWTLGCNRIRLLAGAAQTNGASVPISFRPFA